MRKVLIITIGLILITTTSSVSGATRYQGILDFIDSTRLSDSGFANTATGKINLESTVEAMQIKTYLQDKINNSLDILFYFQSLQNSSGGFSMTEEDSVSLNATILAVQGLKYLAINQSQYSQWNIFPYLNETAGPILMNVQNGSTLIQPLTIYRLKLWYDFLLTSFDLGAAVIFPLLDLTDAIKANQYVNGSYPDFYTAVESIQLLHLLGEEPNDPDLASKYILSFIASNGAFSDTYDGQPSLHATLDALEVLSSIIDINSFEYRTDITRFVFSQQHSRSGFAEVGDLQVTVEATYNGVLILSLLNNIGELYAPDVLQEVGFVNAPIMMLVVTLPYLVLIRRKYYE